MVTIAISSSSLKRKFYR
jgi:hypothetical protein